MMNVKNIAPGGARTAVMRISVKNIVSAYGLSIVTMIDIIQLCLCMKTCIKLASFYLAMKYNVTILKSVKFIIVSVDY